MIKPTWLSIGDREMAKKSTNIENNYWQQNIIDNSDLIDELEEGIKDKGNYLALENEYGGIELHTNSPIIAQQVLEVFKFVTDKLDEENKNKEDILTKK